MGATNSTTLQIVLTTDGQGNVKAVLGGVANDVKQIKPHVEEAEGAFKKMYESIETIKHLMEAWGVYEILKEVVGEILEANAAAQRLQASLIAVTGSGSEAKAVFAELSELAQDTTSSTEQLVNAWIRLRNAGIEPSKELLSSLANVAVGTGQTVDTVANAMANAFEGNARGLKQLGINAKEAGDKIIVTFQGATTVIDNSAQGLTDFFNKIGQGEQFIAAQQASVNSLGGAWHQLWKTLEDDVSTGNGMIGGTVSLLTKLIQQANTIAKPLPANEDNYLHNINNLGYQVVPGAQADAARRMAPDFAGAQQQAQVFREELAQLANETGIVGTATEVYNGIIGRLAGSFRDAANAENEEISARQRAAADQATANASADKLVKDLESEAVAMGRTHAAAVLLRIGTGDLVQADGQHAAAVLRAAQALDVKTQAAKELQKYQAEIAKDEALIESLKKQTDALGLEGIALLDNKEKWDLIHAANKDEANDIIAQYDALRQKTQAVMFDTQSEKDHAEALKDLHSEIDEVNKASENYLSILASLDPVAAVWKKHDDAIKQLVEDWQKGAISFQQLADAIKKVNDSTAESINGSKELTHVYEEIGNGIVNIMTGSMHDAGKKMLEETQNIIKQVAQAWLKAHITAKITTQGSGVGGTAVTGGDALMAGGMFAASTIAGSVGGKAGGAIEGAASGAMAGATFGPWGAVIGAVIGGILGAVSAQNPKTPEVTLSGSGAGTSTFTDDLGTIGIAGKHVNDGLVSQLEQQIEQFDDAIAAFLPADEVDRVKDALSQINERYKGADPDAILSDRLDAVLSVVMPQFKDFIDSLSGSAQRLAAFQGLTKLQDDLKATQSTIVQLSGTPLEKLQDALKTLGTAITQDQDKLATALKARDPTHILTAEQTLKQAIEARYKAEIADIQSLVQAENALEASSYSLNLSLAQKIAQLTGNWSGAADTASARISTLKDEITNDLDFGDALNKVQELSQAVDDWLSSAVSQVQSQYDAQIAQLEDQRSAIQSASQYASEAASAAEQAANDARQAQITALQKQLALAQQWVGILDQANVLVQSLQTGSTNPLGGFSQLDILNQGISQRLGAVSGETGDQQAKDATQLLADLQQRLQLITSGNLYDRSSNEYLAAYNQTLQQIAQIKDLATPKAAQVDKLQAQIDALQAIKSTISSGFSYNGAALDSITQKENELKEQEKKQIDELNKQAAAYYTWAQHEAQTLEAARHKEIVDQLNAITGGVDPTQYIANESTAMAASLNSIDQQITDFLDAISGTVTAAPAAGPGGAGTGSINPTGGGGGGGGGDPGGSAKGMTVNMSVTVNGTGLGAQDIAEAAVAHLNENIGAIANRLKREIKVA